MTIGLVTDSGSDLPWDFAKNNNVKIACLYMYVHDEELKEDENFDRDAYYKLFEDEKAFLHIPKLNLYSFVPKTSQPSPKDYSDAYLEHIKDGKKEIVVVTISSGLSGSINSAHLAAKQVMRQNKDVNIYIVNSLSASYPEVFLIRMALKLIKKKKYSAKEIADILTQQASKIKTIILLPTLRYLWKGGRLGTTKFLLGAMLRKKPIVTMNEEGNVVTVGSTTDVQGGLEESLKLSTDEFSRVPRAIAIVYGSRLDYANNMADIIKKKYPEMEIEIVQSGGSVLSHLGPESIGVISDYTDDEYWE
ncbi:MAG: DegV family protein [Candidatus Heimdallarchaeota archaeon]|nr:DegV family protein [Candidatus Heimdallarchaeota archaeon]